MLSLGSKHWLNLLAPLCGDALKGIIIAIFAIHPFEKILPGDQVGSSNDPARELSGTNCSAQCVFADIHAAFSCTGNGVPDFENICVFSCFRDTYPTCSGICRIECFYSTEKGRHGFPSDSIAAFVSYFTGIENVFNILLLKMASAFQSAAQSYLRRSQPAMAFANRGCRYQAEILHPRCIVRTPNLHHSGIDSSDSQTPEPG